MAWYNGTFSCGHEGRVNIIGKMSERQWKIDKYFSGVCEECKKKEREEPQPPPIKAGAFCETVRKSL